MGYILKNKQKVRLYSWDYTINHNENGDENEKKNHTDTTQIDLGLDIDKKYSKYKKCSSMMMIICIKQHSKLGSWKR